MDMKMNGELTPKEKEALKDMSGDFLQEYINILLSTRYMQGRLDGINWLKEL